MQNIIQTEVQFLGFALAVNVNTMLSILILKTKAVWLSVLLTSSAILGLYLRQSATNVSFRFTHVNKEYGRQLLLKLPFAFMCECKKYQ